tara:strand:+ start:1164 stop:1328 length:165 start_codon:yes stop_codon:yes gene_type:complete
MNRDVRVDVEITLTNNNKEIAVFDETSLKDETLLMLLEDVSEHHYKKLEESDEL